MQDYMLDVPLRKKNEKKQWEKISVLESGGLIWLKSSAAFLVLHY